MLTISFSAITSVLLVCLLGIASLIIREGTQLTREEVSAYECGFEHSSKSRLPFSFRYFLLTLIFLVFDIEIVFLLFLPEGLSFTITPWSVITCSIIFVLLLTIGLFYEWADGSLDWIM